MAHRIVQRYFWFIGFFLMGLEAVNLVKKNKLNCQRSVERRRAACE